MKTWRLHPSFKCSPRGKHSPLEPASSGRLRNCTFNAQRFTYSSNTYSSKLQGCSACVKTNEQKRDKSSVCQRETILSGLFTPLLPHVRLRLGTGFLSACTNFADSFVSTHSTFLGSAALKLSMQRQVINVSMLLFRSSPSLSGILFF